MKTTTYQLAWCQCRYGVHEKKHCKNQPHLLVERDGERLQLCRGCRLYADKLLHDFRDGAFIEGSDETYEVWPRLYTETEVGELQASEGELVRAGMQRKLDEVTSQRDQLLGEVTGLRAAIARMRREPDRLSEESTTQRATITELCRERDDLRISLNEANTEKARLKRRLDYSASVDELNKAQRDKAEQELSSLRGAISDIVNNYDIT